MIERIATAKRTKEIISKYDFAFQKRFGQNFLIDSHVIDKIIAGSHITDKDVILEIGPGIGSLTQGLAEHAKKVIAIEIDKKLIPILQDTLSDYDNIEIINDDILKVDLKALVDKENEGKPIKVVANLPYYITTPIIMGLFEEHVPVESITVMVQKEVGLRMDAVPSTKEYGSLSLAVQYYATTELITNVPPNSFMPRPNVGSAVIKLTTHPRGALYETNEELLFKLIKASFAQRRKTIINSIQNSGIVVLPKEEVQAALSKANIDEKRRGETLSLKEFVDLTNAF